MMSTLHHCAGCVLALDVFASTTAGAQQHQQQTPGCLNNVFCPGSWGDCPVLKESGETASDVLHEKTFAQMPKPKGSSIETAEDSNVLAVDMEKDMKGADLMSNLSSSTALFEDVD